MDIALSFPRSRRDTSHLRLEAALRALRTRGYTVMETIGGAARLVVGPTGVFAIYLWERPLKKLDSARFHQFAASVHRNTSTMKLPRPVTPLIWVRGEAPGPGPIHGVRVTDSDRVLAEIADKARIMGPDHVTAVSAIAWSTLRNRHLK